jgi:hypothetical protein
MFAALSRCASRVTITPYERPNRKHMVCQFDARQGGYCMRQELQLPDDGVSTGYTFHFQITNNGGRQACSVKVQAPSIHDATQFFRQNWSMIESMARDGLTSSDRNVIRLAVP